MGLSTPSRFLLLFFLYLLASCRSEQAVVQHSKPREQQLAPANAPRALAYEVSIEAPVSAPVHTPTAQRNDVDKQPHPAKATRAARANLRKVFRQSVVVARRTVQPRRANKPNVAAVREEGEGKPALLVLGIVLAVAGVVAGFLVGGGAGFFIGLPTFLLGYYFFMKGLLGPNAWIEVANELFQL